jgi:hypothetical protein
MKLASGIFFVFILDYVIAGGRIMNGYPVDIESAPYMARITYRHSNGWNYCSGSILNDRFILTAGHCKMNFIENLLHLIIFSIHRRC